MFSQQERNIQEGTKMLNLKDEQNKFIALELMKKYPDIYEELTEDFERLPSGDLKAILASIKALKANKKIQAIKDVRSILGLGLKEAKDYVEALEGPKRQHADGTMSAQIKPEVLVRLEYYQDKYPEYFV